MSGPIRDDAGSPGAHAGREGDCWDALGSMDARWATEGTEGTDAPAASGPHLAELARTIEHEIIPRLMIAHRVVGDAPRPAAEAAPRFDAAAVQAFARAVIGPDDARAWAEVEAHVAQGVSIECVYVELLAAAARCLGQWWTEDRCGFTDVTIGLGRLQRIMRELSPSFGRAVDPPVDPMRVLLLPSPGEQHTFGLVMVAEFFRRDGWEVAGGAWESGTDAARLVAAEWFDVLGLSLAAEVHADALAACIAEARAASRNRELAVVVGGPIFGLRPEIGARVGADLVAGDGRDAPQLAARAASGRRRHQ